MQLGPAFSSDRGAAAQVAKCVSDLPFASAPDDGNYESFHQARHLRSFC